MATPNSPFRRSPIRDGATYRQHDVMVVGLSTTAGDDMVNTLKWKGVHEKGDREMCMLNLCLEWDK